MLLSANAVSVYNNQERTHVEGVRYATLAGQAGLVKASLFVLAAGGIENARLLLTRDLGNDHGLVGRFFTDHPEPTTGIFVAIDQSDRRWLPLVSEHPGLRNPLAPYVCLSLPESEFEREAIVNSEVGLLYMPPVSPEGYSALRRLVSLEHEDGLSLGELGRDIALLAGDIAGLGSAASRAFWRGSPTVQLFEVHGFGEQSPNPESRITLGSDRDALGLQRPVLDWRLTRLDSHSLKRSLRLVAEEFGRLGLGRMKVDFKDWGKRVLLRKPSHWHDLDEQRCPQRGSHHPKVHGVSNLFIGGSSTFPTSGSVPPTLTIVAPLTAGRPHQAWLASSIGQNSSALLPWTGSDCWSHVLRHPPASVAVNVGRSGRRGACAPL